MPQRPVSDSDVASDMKLFARSSEETMWESRKNMSDAAVGERWRLPTVVYMTSMGLQSGEIQPAPSHSDSDVYGGHSVITGTDSTAITLVLRCAFLRSHGYW